VTKSFHWNWKRSFLYKTQAPEIHGKNLNVTQISGKSRSIGKYQFFYSENLYDDAFSQYSE